MKRKIGRIITGSFLIAVGISLKIMNLHVEVGTSVRIGLLCGILFGVIYSVFYRKINNLLDETGEEEEDVS